MGIEDGRLNMVGAIVKRCNGKWGLTRGSAHGLMKKMTKGNLILCCVMTFCFGMDGKTQESMLAIFLFESA